MNTNDELRIELINSLPSRRIVEVTNNLAVRNPVTKELIFLKQRPRYESVPLEDYIEYNEHHNIHHSYKEIVAKSVIVDLSLIGFHGKEALAKHLEKIK